MEERQTNYTIAESYALPSGGAVYEVAVNPRVELRSMTARDEMKRQNPSSTPFKTLADIIESCMLEKPAIHVYDMALGDYEYLLHRLRVVTYGDSYKLTVICNHCGSTIDAEAHLNELELKEFDIEKFNQLRELTLPKSNKLVRLNFQTPHMLDDIDTRAKELKRKFKSADINFDMLALLTAVIDSVDGISLNIMEKETFINNLPAMDMTKIINTVDELNAMIGLKNELIVECDKCGGEVQTFFRFGQEFFRPSNI